MKNYLILSVSLISIYSGAFAQDVEPANQLVCPPEITVGESVVPFAKATMATMNNYVTNVLVCHYGYQMQEISSIQLYAGAGLTYKPVNSDSMNSLWTSKTVVISPEMPFISKTTLTCSATTPYTECAVEKIPR